MACRAPATARWTLLRLQAEKNADFDPPKTHFYLFLCLHCALEQEFRRPGQDPNRA
jgi:hypothetical protein